MSSDSRNRRLRAYPDTTGLQAWSVAIGRMLDGAREQLSDREYRELVATITVRLARENATFLEAA